MLLLVLLSSAGSARDDTAAKQRVEGYCGKTSTDSLVKSDDEACKSFFQEALAPKSLNECTLRCLKCGGCRYATFSHKMRDCSLYEECDVGHLAQGHGYQTRDVQGLTESTLARTRPLLPPPPPPPPPLPPREPGDWRDAACLEPAKGDQPVFAIFGGSNSAGTNSLRYTWGEGTRSSTGGTSRRSPTSSCVASLPSGGQTRRWLAVWAPQPPQNVETVNCLLW